MPEQIAFDQIGRMLACTTLVQPVEYVFIADISTIGRASICTIVVQRGTEQSLVSRIHARVERDGMHYVLHDTSSANGTFVNNHRIHGPHLFKHEDIIGLGSTSPRFCASSTPTRSNLSNVEVATGSRDANVRCCAGKRSATDTRVAQLAAQSHRTRHHQET